VKGHLRIREAEENNLRAVDLDLPHGQWIAVCGVSGSGKSSLVYDVIYAEARRRFMAALEGERGDVWRRGRPPRVGRIEGLAPALALEQGGRRANPRSTVASLSGLHDYVRLLFARLGQPHCLNCGAAVQSHRFEEVYETALGFAEGTRLLVLAPRRIDVGFAGSDLIEWIDRSGYRRLRIEGQELLLEEIDSGALVPGQRIEIVVDRLVVKPDASRRLRGSLQAALDMAGGQVALARVGHADDLHFAVEPACLACSTPFAAIDVGLFSHNSAQGACPTCRGLGTQMGLDMERFFGAWALSVEEAVGPLWTQFGHRKIRDKTEAFCGKNGVEMDDPLAQWPDDVRQRLWAGGRGQTQGLRRSLEQIAAQATGDEMAWLEERMDDAQCSACQGRRLRPEALAVQVDGLHVGQFNGLTIRAALSFVETLQFTGVRAMMADEICGYLCARLRTLDALGVGYLTLGRRADSLSSGEYQRLRLGAALESGMTQMLYVLDEPSAGLHARDAELLASALSQLRDEGNTVLVVEHDRSLVAQADWLVDMGPGAGERGGHIVASGPPNEALEGDSLTGRYVRGDLVLEEGRGRSVGGRGWLRLYGVRGHNLSIEQVDFPLGNLVGISGVSGSGKSSLVHETLYPLLAGRLQASERRPLPCAAIEGTEGVARVVAVDQRPIGRSRRSNAATYTGLLAPIRRLFAELPVARMRAYGPSHFSFNAPQGACQACGGSGISVLDERVGRAGEIPCSSCSGLRYRSEVLDVHFRQRHMAEVLDMSVDEALAFFEVVPEVARRLRMLSDVGLGYLRLGQDATSFSGGEAQRIKLAAELGRVRQGDTLYILDEPTTGLHMEDVRLLLLLLQRLVDEGNTVVVIEHHIELLAAVDWLIELGPEAGEAGGRIVTTGCPRDVALVEEAHTGRYLRAHFAQRDARGCAE
jgi:excinuclease ABC subunit A